MRVKRYKEARKTMAFFKLSFGFNTPYKVLMDAEFIAAALENRVQLQDQVPKFLQEDTNLFVTKCIVSDLEQRASKDTFWKGAYLIAKKMKYLRCAHGNLAHPHDCIKVLVQKNDDDYSKDTTEKAKKRAAEEGAGSETTNQTAAAQDDKRRIELNTAGKGRKKKIEYNAEKLILGIQHAPLRIELRQVPAVPFLHLKGNVLKLEDPSDACMRYAGKMRSTKQFESANSAQTGLAVLDRLKKVAAEDIDLHDLHRGNLVSVIGAVTEEERAKLREDARKARAQQGVLLPKAKAPNPLSCKKKQRKDPAQQGKKTTTKSADVKKLEKPAGSEEDGDKKKRKRVRKRKSDSISEDSDKSAAPVDAATAAASTDKKDTKDASVTPKLKQTPAAQSNKRSKHAPAPISHDVIRLQKRIRTFTSPEEASIAKPTVGRASYLVKNNHNQLMGQRKEIEQRALADGVDLNDY